LWCLTPLAIDGSSRVGSEQMALQGISLIPAVSGVTAPSVTTGGVDVFFTAGSGGSIYLRPQANNNNNMFSSAAGAGQWNTYDSGGAQRNTLDDGTGNMKAKAGAGFWNHAAPG